MDRGAGPGFWAPFLPSTNGNIRTNFNGIQLLLLLNFDRVSKKNTVPSALVLARVGLNGEKEISKIGELWGLNTIFRLNPSYGSPLAFSTNFKTRIIPS